MSGVKRLLRSARECLGRREYRDALQHCKEALTEDKSCYEAYIYVGKAAFHLQEHAQAEAAYQRAADLDPRNPLAWQGLAELAAETGSWVSAADCYGRLLALAEAAPPEDPLRGRRAAFLRRHAEAAARGGLLQEAEAAWRALAEEAAEALSAAEAKAAEGDGGEAAEAVATAEAELVECLCRLADVQLAEDSHEIELRVAARMQEEGAAGATPEQAAALEAAVRGTVEGEWAEEALELDADHASATLRRIIALRPPAPPFAPYYDAFLKRLRKYIQAAPPGSMDRHSRRAVLLAAAKATMEGRCGQRFGGCCAPYPYEAALAMLEVENEVVGAEDPSLDPSAAPTLEPPSLPLLVADSGRIAARLSHSFPWSPTAQLHNALCLRRRALTHGFDAAAVPAAGAGAAAPPAAAQVVVARLPPAGGAAGGGAGSGRRRQVTKLLLSALSRGGRGVSGWLAACELLLEEGAAEAALDAAKEGLKYVAARDLLGKERLGGAGLLLRLRAGQALLRLRKLDEAQLLLEGLAHGVSEGHVASGELAGVPPTSVSAQARRALAHVAAARGDLPGARQRFEEMVGGHLMGRSAAPVEAWAAGELGMVLLKKGASVEGARYHLQSALTALQPSLASAVAASASAAATSVTALQQEAAAYHMHLALALWARGGGSLPRTHPPGADGGGEAAAAAAYGGAGPTAEPFRSECRQHLLAAAGVAGPLQAGAFTWLGHWYGRAADPRDGGKAARCYQRALALDPTQSEAGEALVAALVASGRADTARQLAEEMAARAAAAVAAGAAAVPIEPSPFLVYPGLLPGGGGGGAGGEAGGGGVVAGWAQRCLARLQRDGGAHTEAVNSYQSAIRLSPDDAELWEGLAASYQALGRHTAALKSYGRALELAPGRLFSRLQAAALHYQMGEMPAALSYYRTALVAAPGHAAALLGCGEVLLAQAALAARLGAAGGAAAELAEAGALAAEATRRYGNLQAGWKLLGDVRMQHAAVPTLDSVAATRGSAATEPTQGSATLAPAGAPGSGPTSVRYALDAARARLAALRSGRRAYAAAVHLDPRVAGLWGDLGLSYHLQLELAGQHPELELEAGASAAMLRRRALALARGGLRLAPASDWLWGAAGAITAAAATGGGADGAGPDASATAVLANASTAEYCLTRSLQLNPRRAAVWATLGRLYAAHGEGGLASRCFDSARSHEPTSIAVWEAMGDAALRRGGVPASGSGGGVTDPRVAPALRDAADAYEHAQLLGGDVESRLGYVLGSMLLRGGPAAAEGSVLAAASKATAMQPLLPAAHAARGLALEARGDFGAAAQALQTALSLMDAAGTDQDDGFPASFASSPHASSRPLVAPVDPRVARSPRAALQLDLARVLASAGRHTEALSLYEALRAQGVGWETEYGARLSYAMALHQAGRSAEALPQLAALIAPAAAPVKLRLAAAAGAVRMHVAARRWDEAYGVVLGATADLPDEGAATAEAAAAAAKLWLILLAGLVAARAPELEPELLQAIRGWAAGRKDVDLAQLECRIGELLTAKHRATGAAAAALRQAAAAIHACPSDRAARALLATTALAAGPRYAALAARAAPRERPPLAAAAAGENAVGGLATATAVQPLVPSAAAVHAAGAVAAAAAAAAGGAAARDAATVVAVREAAARMRRVVHAQPHEAAAWYLCAQTELQHAVASGGQARLYRSAAVAARAAAARAQAELAALPAEPPGAAAAARPAAMPGLPPVMALAMAAARSHAPADPRVTAHRAQRACLADAAVRSLAALSECRLQLRGREGPAAAAPGAGGEQGAREAAEEALRFAQAHGTDQSPAHRQLARLHVAQGDMASADAEYDKACKAAASAAGTASSGSSPTTTYQLLPLLEWSAVRLAAGNTSAALQQLNGALGGGGTAAAVAVVPPRPAAALADLAAVQRAMLLLQVGDVEGARSAAAEAAAVGGGAAAAAVAAGLPSAGLRAAAHTLQAAAALLQASSAASADGADGGASTAAAARKRSLLEARWAARAAMQALSPAPVTGPMGPVPKGAAPRGGLPTAGPASAGAAVAAALLAHAEMALGKEEAAREAEQTAERLWPRSAMQPVEAFAPSASAPASAGALSGPGAALGRSRAQLAHAVHCRPWALGEAWGGLVAAARAC